jgi:hypothetical protein
MRRILLAVLMVSSAVPAAAQTDIIVMRKTMDNVAFKSGEGAYVPKPGRWVVGDPVVTPGCSASQPTRATVTCQDDAGHSLPANRCTAPKPDGLGTTPNYASCSYRYVPGEWSSWDSACSETARRTRTVTCTRSDGTTAAPSQCHDAAPPATETSSILTGCTYVAHAGEWGAWSSTCSTTATHSRDVTCIRADGRTVDSTLCPQPLPATSEKASVLTSCSYVPAYSASYSECRSGSQSAPIVSCTRSDGVQVDNALCAQQTTTRSCIVPGTWSTGTWSASSSTCSSTAKQTRTVTCTVEGETVADSRCAAKKPDTEQTISDYTSCTYTPTYSATFGACVDGSQSAPITSCTRSDPAHTVVANSMCGADKQVKTQFCQAYSCGTFTSKAYVPGSSVTLASNVNTNADAASKCQAYAASKKQAGACVLETVNQRYLYFVANAKSSDMQVKSYYDQNIAFCQ